MKIILYTKTGCPWCKGVLELFAEKGMKNGIDYEEMDVLTNPIYFDELVAKSGQKKAPTLDFGGEIVADSDRNQIQAFLKGKGYDGF